MLKKSLGIMGLFFGIFLFSVFAPALASAAEIEGTVISEPALSVEDREILNRALSQLYALLNKLQDNLAQEGLGEETLNVAQTNSTLDQIRVALVSLNEGLESVALAQKESSSGVARIPKSQTSENTGIIIPDAIITENGEPFPEDLSNNELADASENLNGFNWNKVFVATLVLLIAGGTFALSLREPKKTSASTPGVTPGTTETSANP